ncbi:MAG: long-chain fatty acid--CoA ligase [Firmicutes bacterium]|nr:long-chain fatty acid--CoA ligase [Bacillota bacterium]
MPTSDLPWSEEYKVHGVPPTFEPYPRVPSHHFLDEAARGHRRMGLVQMGCYVRYPRLKEMADSAAYALQKMGVKKGDRVATILPTSIQFFLADHAISKAGAAHVPCSFLEPPEILLHKFQEAGPLVVITLDQHLEMVQKLQKNASFKEIIVTNLQDFSRRPPRSKKDPGKGVHRFMELISEKKKPLRVNFNPDNDIETLLFTGGTTGLPKGCMLSHGNIVANSIQNSFAMGIISQTLIGNSSVLLGVPFFHSYGHCLMHTMTLMGFTQLLVPDARDIESMVQMIREHRPVLHVGVPTQFMKMVEGKIDKIGLFGLSGSAALPPETQKQFEEKEAGVIMEGYGLSEMSPVTHFNASVMIRIFGGRRILSLISWLLRLPGILTIVQRLIRIVGYKFVGRVFSWMVLVLTKLSGRISGLSKEEKQAAIGIPFPDTAVKVVDLETGRELSYREMIEEGKTGEMMLKGPQRMLGYWPVKGTGYDKEGFIHSGDVVTLNEEGYFRIVDRTKDMINVSGYKVYSRELDDILYGHPAVALAAAVGVPDPVKPGSETVKVFIQLKKNYQGEIAEPEIRQYLKAKVAKYAMPKQIEFLEEMPLTEIQKVNKKFLREQELKQAAHQ